MMCGHRQKPVCYGRSFKQTRWGLIGRELLSQGKIVERYDVRDVAFFEFADAVGHDYEAVGKRHRHEYAGALFAGGCHGDAGFFAGGDAPDDFYAGRFFNNLAGEFGLEAGAEDFANAHHFQKRRSDKHLECDHC